MTEKKRGRYFKHITTEYLADGICTQQHVSDVFNGKRGMSWPKALILAEKINITPDLIMNKDLDAMNAARLRAETMAKQREKINKEAEF